MISMRAKGAARLQNLGRLVEKFRNNDSGATAIEYSLIGAMIFMAIILAVTAVGGAVSESFSKVESGFEQ